ncbi:hypothetical protein M3147_08435 [Agromyces mediolanus]|uniref:hypothetical protein n=1 Tax=Agromyces mediolanus TaxID=41986 RepID=UPI00203B5D2D|nr:hypothetical protein [Agromyces mediolanus]MCM3657276.1 hypothetical protein [Agromyces mediolanus]
MSGRRALSPVMRITLLFAIPAVPVALVQGMKVTDAFATSPERGWEALSWIFAALGVVVGILAAIVLVPGLLMERRCRQLRARSLGDVFVARKSLQLSGALSTVMRRPVVRSPWTEHVIVAVEAEGLTFFRLLGPDVPIALIPCAEVIDVTVAEAQFSIGRAPALTALTAEQVAGVEFLPQRPRSLWMCKMRPAELATAAESLRSQLGRQTRALSRDGRDTDV